MGTLRSIMFIKHCLNEKKQSVFDGFVEELHCPFNYERETLTMRICSSLFLEQ